MEYDNNNLKEIELMQKKVADLPETVTSIHNTFMYAASLVLKNLGVFLVLAIFGITINLIATSSFSEFIELFKSIDPTNLTDIELKSEELVSLLFKGLATSVSLQLTSTIFFIIFAAYVCSRKAEDAALVNDLGNIITLLFQVILQLAVLMIIKLFVIFIGLLAIIPGAIFLAQMLLAQYILIFERKGILHSLSRSSELMYGVKGNFLTFLTYASLIFIPAWIVDFISGGIATFVSPNENVSFTNGILAIASELFKQYIWFTYSVGACLLYLRRSAKE